MLFRVPILFYAIKCLSVIARLFTRENWKQKGLHKKKAVESLIPTEWLLPLSITSKISETSLTNVLSIPKSSGLLSELEIKITEDYTVKQLLAAIHSGSLSSLEVTKAFCKRAAIAHQLTNCCTEFMFDLAYKRSEELDEYLAKNGEPIGPLHGLPISLKDTFNIPGFDSAIGYVSFIGNKDQIHDYSNLVKILLDLGAVLYVKTNVPQTLMAPDTDNNVMGRCLNPLNTSLSAGGSSGGEASLIKQRGAIIGIGTDVGGSLRIPAICCGTYSIKPSTGRLPYGGQTAPGLKDTKGFSILSTLGVISNDLEGIQFLMKQLVLKEPWNYGTDVLPIQWNDDYEKTGKKLKIGVIFEDTAFPIHPPMKRVLEEVVAKLGAHHELVILDSHPSFLESWKCTLMHFMLQNNFHTAQEVYCSGEPPIPSLATNGAEVFGSPPMTLNGVSKMIFNRREIIASWNQVFIDNDFDVILSPGSPSTAPPHDTYGAVPYTATWNLTDFPCLILPYGKVEECDKNELMTTSKDNYSFICAQYDQLKYLGGEAHIQLTCRQFQEEKLLEAATIINSILQGV